MNARKPADDRVIPNRDVPSEGRRIRHDDMASEVAIVGDMDVGHQHVVIAETRHAPTKGRRPIDRHIFTENVVIADPDEGLFPLILEMLRGRAQRDE